MFRDNEEHALAELRETENSLPDNPAREAMSQQAFDLYLGRGRQGSSADIQRSGSQSQFETQAHRPAESGRQPEGKSSKEVPPKPVKSYSYSGGITITEYDNGDSVKEIKGEGKVTTRADGTMIFQDRAGRTTMIIENDGSTVLFHKNNRKTIQKPDRTTITENADGSITTIYPDLSTKTVRPEKISR